MDQPRWIVKVWDKRDPELDLPGYQKRFEFFGDHAATEAWTCWSKAIQHGFEATVDQVSAGRRSRVREAT